MGGALDLARQAWTQGLMAHGTVSVKQAQKMHKSIILALRIPYSPLDFGELHASANRALSRVGLDIRRTRDEASGVEVLTIVNTRGDEIAQLATLFTSHEIAFVKLLIQEIFTASNNAYNVSSMYAVNLGHQLDPELSAGKVEIICKKLIRQGWLRSQQGFYSLTPRFLMELQTYLRANFEEYVHTCVVCKDIVTLGFACATRTCDAYVHSFCRVSHESIIEDRNHRGSFTCDKCDQPWRPIKIGEHSTRSTSSGNRSSARGRATRRRAAEQEDLIDEQEEEEQDNGDDDDERRRTKRRRTSVESQEQAQEDDDDNDGESFTSAKQEEEDLAPSYEDE